jgi:hypothetical protein
MTDLNGVSPVTWLRVVVPARDVISQTFLPLALGPSRWWRLRNLF